jgi:hypothetical protein
MAVNSIATIAIRMLVTTWPWARSLNHAEHGHRRRRLDDDDAVENQIPQRERPQKFRCWSFARTADLVHGKKLITRLSKKAPSEKQFNSKVDDVRILSRFLLV